MSDRDYYEILGLTPRADGAMVDASYWHLVRKYQALAATNPRAQRMIDELNEAYGVLGNPRLRQQYDAFRDDVLIRSGMIQPVASTPKRKRSRSKADSADAPPAHRKRSRKVKAEDQAAEPALALPRIQVQNWRTYSIAGIIALLAFAAAWQGVNIVLVVLALAGGLGLALTPTLTRRISEMSFDMPAMPSVTIPQVKAPKINLGEIPAIRDFSAGAKDDGGIDADTLRTSTAQTIARWRTSVGLKVAPQEPVADGDDIDIDEEPAAEGETAPLDAVMHILRNGAQRTPSSR